MDHETRKYNKDKRLLVLIMIGVIITGSHYPFFQSTSSATNNFFYLKEKNSARGKLFRFPASWKPETCLQWVQAYENQNHVTGVEEKTNKHKLVTFYLSSSSGIISDSDTDSRLNFFFHNKISICNTDSATLTMLPGIGKKLARKIFFFTQNKLYCNNITYLEEIPGIGKSLAIKLGPYLSFNTSPEEND